MDSTVASALACEAFRVWYQVPSAQGMSVFFFFSAAQGMSRTAQDMSGNLSCTVSYWELRLDVVLQLSTRYPWSSEIFLAYTELKPFRLFTYLCKLNSC